MKLHVIDSLHNPDHRGPIQDQRGMLPFKDLSWWCWENMLLRLSRYFCWWRQFGWCIIHVSQGIEEGKGQRQCLMFQFFLSCHKVWILFHICMSSENSSCWNPNPPCNCNLNEVLRLGPSSYRITVFIKRRALLLSLSCHVRTQGRLLPTSQKECSYHKLTKPAPCFWTFQPPELWEITFCCLSDSVLLYFVRATQVTPDMWEVLLALCLLMFRGRSQPINVGEAPR